MVDRDARALARRYSPAAILAVVVLFMFWVRMRPADRVITDSAVLFSGNDAWYHLRATRYVVRYFPDMTPFDPWSNFPFGTGRHSGFGGLFDQLVALAALIVGLGNPSDRLVALTLAVAPPVLGALTAVPTYVLGRRLTDRWGGALAAVFLSLAGGGILFRTVVGAADHQSGEALFGTLAVVGVAGAVAVAERERPLVGDLRGRDWPLVRAPLVAGILGGVAVAAYLMLWPPGVMLLFTVGVFVVVQLVRDHLAGEPLDRVAFAAVPAMVTTGVLTLLYARTTGLSATAFSLLQPLVAFGVAAGTVVLVALSRYLDREGYEPRAFPAAVAGLAAGSFALMAVVFPRGLELFGRLVTRVYSFGLLTSTSAGTVQEIQPGSVADAFAAFGGMTALAAAGLVVLGYAVVRENRPVALFVLLWSLSNAAAYFTMSRFGYYLAVNVAILGAYAVHWIAVGLLSVEFDAEDGFALDRAQAAGLLIVVLLVLPGNVLAVSARQPAWNQADRIGGADGTWYDGLEWLQANSPEIPMGYYERYDRPADGDFDYPPGAYGVASWWDYGHWITVIGHRIPYANPFQEGPETMSAYFQAENETRASLLLEALPSFPENPSRVTELSNPQLRDVVADQPDSLDTENGRYVVIDDEMAGGKFSAITRWTGPGFGAYLQQGRYALGGQNVTLGETSERYETAMVSSLYYRDARGLGHYRLVHEVDDYAIVGGYISGQNANPLTSLPLRGGWPEVRSLAQRLDSADEARQVVPIGQRQYVYDAAVESSVKTFEHVEGATLAGTAPDAENGTVVTATLELETHTGRTFTYTQRATVSADGSFELTVPYPTNQSVGPTEGGTDASVEAVGQYTVRVGNETAPTATATVAVPEPAVYDGERIDVSLGSGAGGNETG